jgi:SAM-dependent methyltransferase
MSLGSPRPRATEGEVLLRDGERARQLSYFREQVNREFEIERPRGAGRLYDYLLRYKFRTAIESLPFSLANARVLNICCGSGMDVEFMAEQTARAIGLDFSKEAVLRARERARRRGFHALLVVGDAENLPFRNDAVAVGFVHDGLHHLAEPHRAIHELVRVARDAVVLVEPAKALLTRVAVKLGLSVDYEDAGNYVYRFSRNELASVFRGLGIGQVTIRRYLMYYHHEPRWYYKLFDKGASFALFRLVFLATNALAGSWGNKLTCVALKHNDDIRQGGSKTRPS